MPLQKTPQKTLLAELPFWGLDLDPRTRPAVPWDAAPHPLPGAHWDKPEQQPIVGLVLTRAGLLSPTPVFGTAVPPRGISGKIRIAAYRIPDHFVRHWALLIAADRVDVLEGKLSRLKGSRADAGMAEMRGKTKANEALRAQN
jgi:hypothetical protein